MAAIQTLFGPLDEPRDHFVLDRDRQAVPATYSEYRAFTESGLHLVAETRLGAHATITTYFNGFDLDYGEEAVPYLYETISMVAEDGGEEGSYRTWEEAEEGHHRTVEHFRVLLGIPDATQPELSLVTAPSEPASAAIDPARDKLTGFPLPAAQLSFADVQSLHDQGERGRDRRAFPRADPDQTSTPPRATSIRAARAWWCARRTAGASFRR